MNAKSALETFEEYKNFSPMKNNTDARKAKRLMKKRK